MIPRRKVLTVDDSKTVRMIVRKVFRAHPFEIFEAENGREGLTMVAHERPALIFLDITMPEMDGIEMLTRLQADPELSSIPVTMLSAEGGRAHIDRVMSLGARAYIVKPFKPAELIETAERLLAETGSGGQNSGAVEK